MMGALSTGRSSERSACSGLRKVSRRLASSSTVSVATSNAITMAAAIIRLVDTLRRVGGSGAWMTRTLVLLT